MSFPWGTHAEVSLFELAGEFPGPVGADLFTHNLDVEVTEHVMVTRWRTSQVGQTVGDLVSDDPGRRSFSDLDPVDGAVAPGLRLIVSDHDLPAR